MDLIDLLHINNDIMSYSLAFASLAYSVGGLLSGFLFNYVNRQILIAGYFIIFGLSNIVTPFINNYMVFSVITVFKMMCAGGTDCGANVWILDMWPGKDAWLQALHFAFAVGCALGPLIVEPFLSVENKDEMDKLAGKTSGTTTISDQNNETRIHVPYGVSGLASIGAACFILYLYWLENKRKRVAQKLRAKQQLAAGEHILLTNTHHPAQIEAANSPSPPAPGSNNAPTGAVAPAATTTTTTTTTAPSTAITAQITKITSKAKEQTVGRPPYYVMAAIALAAMCLSFYCGIEITSMNYLATFAVNIDLQLPKSTAALMSSALTISFAIGRGFGIWIANYMRPHKLFYLCAGVMALGNVFMLIFANTAETLLWYSICLFGIGCGPMFPAIVSFYDDRISKVTNTVSGIFILGSMFNVALNSLIIGHHIIDNALILIVCNLIGSILLMLLFGTLHMLTKVKKNQRVKKFNRLKQQSQQVQPQQQQSLLSALQSDSSIVGGGGNATTATADAVSVAASLPAAITADSITSRQQVMQEQQVGLLQAANQQTIQMTTINEEGYDVNDDDDNNKHEEVDETNANIAPTTNNNNNSSTTITITTNPTKEDDKSVSLTITA